MPVKIQLRRATASQWSSANPILTNGELVVEIDTNKIKIGDGTTAWNSLAYGGTLGVTGAPGVSSATSGALSYMPMSSAPSGWLAADGTQISSSTYPNLAGSLPSSITVVSTPTSISTSGYAAAAWQPTLQLFNDQPGDSYINDGSYLSTYIADNTFFDSFSITFNQPVKLSSITMLNIGYGAAPSGWSIRSIAGVFVASATNTNFTDIGGYTTTGAINWYNFSTSVTAQTYIISLKHNAGYTTDLGIARMAFRITNDAANGFKILPQLSSTVSPTLYPYIKT